MYTPHTFTHQGVHDFPLGPEYPDPTWHSLTLRNVLAPVRLFQREHNVPVWIGEFSAIRWAEGAETYLRDVSEIFKEYGWGWEYFSYNGYHGWNPGYSPEFADEKSLWESQYVGLLSRRWTTINRMFGKGE